MEIFCCLKLLITRHQMLRLTCPIVVRFSPFGSTSPLVKRFCTQNKSSTAANDRSKADIKVTFIKSDGQRIVGYGKEDENFLDVIINNNLDIDGFGACEGTLACSTCHLIFKKEDFDSISNKPSDEELDMLDLAYGLSDTSRLGCQVNLIKEMDGIEVVVPETANDARLN